MSSPQIPSKNIISLLSIELTKNFNTLQNYTVREIPTWLMDWIPEEGGYLLGNLQPPHMDFRFFMLGNLWSIVSSSPQNYLFFLLYHIYLWKSFSAISSNKVTSSIICSYLFIYEY